MTKESVNGQRPSTLYIYAIIFYHFSAVIGFSSVKYSGSTGNSGEIYSEDTDGESRARNLSVINRVL